MLFKKQLGVTFWRQPYNSLLTYPYHRRVFSLLMSAVVNMAKMEAIWVVPKWVLLGYDADTEKF